MPSSPPVGTLLVLPDAEVRVLGPSQFNKERQSWRPRWCRVTVGADKYFGDLPATLLDQMYAWHQARRDA